MQRRMCMPLGLCILKPADDCEGECQRPRRFESVAQQYVISERKTMAHVAVHILEDEQRFAHCILQLLPLNLHSAACRGPDRAGSGSRGRA